MKIALVCPYNMFQHAGGVQQLIQHLHEGLIKKGHEVKVITQRPASFKGEAPNDYILFGTVRDFKNGLGFGANGIWGMPADNDEISSILEKENFDVIHFHEPWAPMLAWQLLKHSKSAHVGTFHANLVDGIAAKTWPRIFTPYARGIGKKMHVITAVSPAPAAIMIQKAETESEKKLVANIKYIPNGIDSDLYKPLKRRSPLNGPNTKTILFVGRLDRRKGLSYLVEAYAKLIETMPQTHLIIAGNGTQRRNLELKVKSLQLEKVHFTGFVSDEEKRRLIGNADILVSPALYGESFGIVLIEAMAMGTPAIGGRNSGYTNVLKGYGRVGLIDPKSVKDFSDRIALFLTEPRIRNAFIRWGLKEVKQYDYPKIINQYEEAYKEAIAIRDKRKKPSLAKENEQSSKKALSRLFVRRHA